MIGLLVGRIILQNMVFWLAPSIIAASDMDWGTVSKKPFAIRYPRAEDPEYTIIIPIWLLVMLNVFRMK